MFINNPHTTSPVTQFSQMGVGHTGAYPNNSQYTNNWNNPVPPEYNAHVYYQYDFIGRGRRGFDRVRGRPQCKFFGKLGHIVATCWFLFHRNFVSLT